MDDSRNRNFTFIGGQTPGDPFFGQAGEDDALSLRRQLDSLRAELTARELELKRAVSELDSLRELYLGFYEHSPIGYLTVDRDGVILDVNGRCAEMLGQGKGSIAGTNLLLLVVEELREACRLFLRKVFDTESFQRAKLRILKADKSSFHAQLEGIAIKGAAGRTLQCRIALSDITERDRVEKLLHIQRDLSRELSSIYDVRKAAESLLDSCIRIEGVDCGGFYTMDGEGEELSLSAHKGISPEFAAKVAKFPRGSIFFDMVLRGMPVHIDRAEIFKLPQYEIYIKERFKTIFVVPVHYEGVPVACMNLASHTLEELPSVSRAALESIASETGGVFARIRMESALRDGEQRLSGIMNNASAIIYVKDLQGRFTMINDHFSKVFKMPKDRILGKTNKEIFPLADAESFMEHDRQVLLFNKPMEFEEVFELPGGRRTYLTVKFPLYDKAGKACAVCGIDTDITARKISEERLRLSEERFRTVADFTYDWEYWLSPKGEFLYMSPSFQRISGYPVADFISDPSLFKTIIHPDDLACFMCDFTEDMLPPGVHHSEFRLIAKSGEERWIGHVCQPVFDSSGAFVGCRGSNTDITDRKRAYSAMRNAMEQAEAANRVKSQFIANLSHEIRTPMNAVIGFTDLVMSTQLSDYQQKCLKMVKSKGEDLLSIINDILDISKIEAGKMQISPSRTNLRDMVKETVRSFLPHISQKGISLSTRIADDIPEEFVCDPLRIRQILANLIGNAVKFTSRGGVSVSLSKSGDPQPGEPMTVLFTVADTGIGIPKDKLSAIFEAFTQADSSTVRKYGGTGLGLAICKNLVSLMDGQIWAESEVGKGSSFLFTLKLDMPPKAPPPKNPGTSG